MANWRRCERRISTRTAARFTSEPARAARAAISSSTMKARRCSSRYRPASRGDALLLAKDDGSAWNKSHQARPMAEACKRAKITADRLVSHFAPHLGFARRHGRRPAHGGRAQSWAMPTHGWSNATTVTWRRPTSRTPSARRHRNSGSSPTARWFRSRAGRRLVVRRIGIATRHGRHRTDLLPRPTRGAPRGSARCRKKITFMILSSARRCGAKSRVSTCGKRLRRRSLKNAFRPQIFRSKSMRQ